jgi:hypothetical protein
MTTTGKVQRRVLRERELHRKKQTNTHVRRSDDGVPNDEPIKKTE